MSAVLADLLLMLDPPSAAPLRLSTAGRLGREDRAPGRPEKLPASPNPPAIAARHHRADKARVFWRREGNSCRGYWR